MSRVLVWMYRHADRLAWLFGAAVLLSQLLMAWALRSLEPSVLHLQTRMDVPGFFDVLRQWGPEGRARYLAHFDQDNLHILLFSVLGALLAASRLYRGRPARERWAVGLLLPLAGLADLVENGLHQAVLRADTVAQPAIAAQWVPVAGGASALKWVLVLAFVGALAVQVHRQHGPRYMAWLELKLPPVALMLGTAALQVWLGLSPLGRLPGGGWLEPFAWLCAALLASAAAVLVGGGVRAFQKAHTTMNPTKPTTAQAMVTQGVYRLSRNPMYAGMALALLALAVAMRQPLALLPLIGFVAYLTRFQIRPEEDAMEARFGPAYRLYAQQVRRWL